LVAPDSPAGNTLTDPTVDDEPQSSTVTLQRIPIPTFSGELFEWQRFRHLFHSLVHSNKTMTKIAKFHYLISSVTGAAATTLDELDISPENYNDAWEALLEEYDNKRALIRTHLQTIVHLPNGKLETALELKKLKDTMHVTLLNVTKLECQISNWDPLLVIIMSKKFDPQTEAKWNEYLGDFTESPSYKELNAFLNRCIHSLPASSGVAPTVVNNPQKKGRSVVHSVSVQNCVNCDGSHDLPKCKKFLSLLVEQHRALALEKQACFNCLWLNHFAQECSSKSRCARCRRSHHNLLHPEEDRITRRIGERESGTGDPESQSVASPSSAVGSDVVVHVQAAQPKVPREDRGVLPTAWVDFHTTEDRRVPVRTLVDQYSTLSFISESLCRTLRTKRQRIDVTISGVAEMERGYEKQGFARTIPSRQTRPDDPSDGICASKCYRVYGPANSASRYVAPSPRY
jgi:hypothetical protein